VIKNVEAETFREDNQVEGDVIELHQAMIGGLDPNHSNEGARVAMMQEVVTINSRDQRVSLTQQ